MSLRPFSLIRQRFNEMNLDENFFNLEEQEIGLSP
jgi:hypothetical protein